MKNTIFTFVFVASILFVGALQTQAEIVSDVSTDANQDVIAAAIDVVSDTSTDMDQDGAAGITSDSSADLAQDGSAGIVADSSTDTDQDGPAGIVSSPSTNEDQDGQTPTTPTDNGTNDGSNENSSNGGGSSRNSRTATFNPMVLGVTTTSCPLITDYLRFGGENNSLQVTKLQIFLKNSEGASLTVNGIFDQQTEDAVKAFQKKYMADILGPWDATRATGFVFITTMKKVNALACAQPIVLSAEEAAIIEAYKARGGSDQAGSEVGAVTTGSEQVATTGGTDETSSNDNVAAAGKVSILSRFWNFLKDLFK